MSAATARIRIEHGEEFRPERTMFYPELCWPASEKTVGLVAAIRTVPRRDHREGAGKARMCCLLRRVVERMKGADLFQPPQAR